MTLIGAQLPPASSPVTEKTGHALPELDGAEIF
jgi:hypothetical protein